MNRDGNLGGGGFGRRRSALMDVPTDTRATRGASFAATEREEEASRLTPVRLAIWLFGGIIMLLCLEGFLSSTSLITPINPLFLNIMRGIGFVLGIFLGLFTVIRPQQPMGLFKKLLVLIFTPFLMGFVGGEVAWRVSDWIEFGFSPTAFEPASYPIKYASHGRKGRRDSFEIDPFDAGESTDIAVPSDQFDAIWPNYDGYCITVMQRRSASGAIEIRNNGVFTLYEPAPAVLTRCGASSGPDSAGSPWDKKEPQP